MKEKLVKIILIIALILIAVCIGSGIVLFTFEKIEETQYNRTKEEELVKMVEFINAKYNYNFEVSDCTYYREEDYSGHYDLLGNGKKYNIPYIGVFKKGDNIIMVADRKGLLSDDGQLDEINSLIGGYFSKLVGTDIEFVQIKKSYNGGIMDYTINSILQNTFNEKMTKENINLFMDEVFKEDDLELIFYIKDAEDMDLLIDKVTTELSYLEQYENIDIVSVYFYDRNEELIVNTIQNQLINSDSDDYYDDYKFGYYYVPNDIEYYYPNDENSKFKNEQFNTFVASAHFDLDRGYSPGKGQYFYKNVNNWFVNIYYE